MAASTTAISFGPAADNQNRNRKIVLTSAEILKKCPKTLKAPDITRLRKGMLQSVPNINRHKPIYYRMFMEQGIRAISSWVEEFQQELYPWGGRYRFLKDFDEFHGPVDSSEARFACSKCKFRSFPWVEPDRKENQCSEFIPVYDDIPMVYKQYVQWYVCDLKEIYELNQWPCSGVNYWAIDYPESELPKQRKTHKEVYEEEKKLLRPWGGPNALKWPKAGEPIKMEVYALDPKKMDSRFILKRCLPYYEYLQHKINYFMIRQVYDSDE